MSVLLAPTTDSTMLDQDAQRLSVLLFSRSEECRVLKLKNLTIVQNYQWSQNEITPPPSYNKNIAYYNIIDTYSIFLKHVQHFFKTVKLSADIQSV